MTKRYVAVDQVETTECKSNAVCHIRLASCHAMTVTQIQPVNVFGPGLSSNERHGSTGSGVFQFFTGFRVNQKVENASEGWKLLGAL